MTLDIYIAICEVSVMDTATPSLAKQLQDAKIANGGYAYDIANGKRIPNHSLALRIFKATGAKLGPIANVSDAALAEMVSA
jgi:hypothetical protein